MRRLLLIILSLFLTSYFLTLTSSPIHAYSMEDLRKTYCDRRSGNQLNLETWYGGRCKASSPGEAIGFANIILLDIIEKVSGGDGSSDTFKKVFKCISTHDLSATCLVYYKEMYSSDLANNSNNGAINSLGILMGKMYANPPARSTEYIASVWNNLSNKHIVQPVYAQTTTGYGFQAFSGVLGIWKVFRNLTYLLFILAFILYGFMIMFRMKINSQTAISIEMALPKLVIALIMITFSYAIAGFLVDLFYVVVNFFYSILFAANIIKDVGWVKFWTGYSSGPFGPFISVMWFALFVPGFVLGAIFPINNIILQTVLVFSGISLILWIIIVICMLIVFLRIGWMMLKAYVSLVLKIIFAPLILIPEMLPGGNAFGDWVRGIIAELSVFASVMAMFTLSFYFMSMPLSNLGGVGQFLNSYYNVDNVNSSLTILPPLFPQGMNDAGSVSSGPLGWLFSDQTSRFALVGFGIFMMTPKIAEMIYKALKVSSVDFVGSALSEGLAPARRLAQAGTTAATSYATDQYIARRGLPTTEIALGETIEGRLINALNLPRQKRG